jgi:HSP20 family protein
MKGIAMKLKSLIPVGRERSAAANWTDPFVSLQQEIERLFDDFGVRFGVSANGPAGTLTPRMDVAETDKAIELTADFLGFEGRRHQSGGQRLDDQGREKIQKGRKG